MGKWLWRFAKEDTRLWKGVIGHKYGFGPGGWSTNACSSHYGATLWREIRRNWLNFARCTSWKLGRGNRILFWKHKWLEAGCLSTLFPEIFAVAENKNAFVYDYYSRVGRSGTWTVVLRRNVNDWELESYLQLMELLGSINLDDTEDTMVWNEAKDRNFTVKSYYLFIQGDSKDTFPWINLWKNTVPPRVLFFSWCATKGKILTMDNLKRRGYSIVNRCTLCFSQEETIGHILLHCQWTSELWRLSLACFGVFWCLPADLKGFLLAWWCQPMSKRKKKLWRMVPLCVFWLVWKERN